MNYTKMQLTITSYDEITFSPSRTTLAPAEILMLSAVDEIPNGRPLKKVQIMFNNGMAVDFYMDDIDLIKIEEIVGGFIIED